MTGNYHYSVLRGSPRGTQIEKFVCRVEILSQKGARTEVKLLQFHADGRKPGSIMRVKSSNVKPDAVTPKEINVRLPYKDNE